MKLYRKKASRNQWFLFWKFVVFSELNKFRFVIFAFGTTEGFKMFAHEGVEHYIKFQIEMSRIQIIFQNCLTYHTPFWIRCSWFEEYILTCVETSNLIKFHTCRRRRHFIATSTRNWATLGCNFLQNLARAEKDRSGPEERRVPGGVRRGGGPRPAAGL